AENSFRRHQYSRNGPSCQGLSALPLPHGERAGGAGKGLDKMGLFVSVEGRDLSALDLDLDLTPRGHNPEKQARLSARSGAPGREERGTDEASGDRGGAGCERGLSGQARARCSARPGPQAGRHSAAREALAGTGGTCYASGGLQPASATGVQGGPEPAGPRWGPAGERVSRAPEGPAEAVESARTPIA